MSTCKSPSRQAHPQLGNTSLTFPFAGMGRLLGACQQGHQPLLCENTPTSLILTSALSSSLQLFTVCVSVHVPCAEAPVVALCCASGVSRKRQFLTLEWSCQVGSYFQLEARKSCFTQEFRAGTVTFLTVRSLTPSLLRHLKHRGQIKACRSALCE